METGDGTRYGVMAVFRRKTGLGYTVYYGDRSQAGNQSDWGTSAEETHNMRCMAGSLLTNLANRPSRQAGADSQSGPARPAPG